MYRRKPTQAEYDLLYSEAKDKIPLDCTDLYKVAFDYLDSVEWLNKSCGKEIALKSSKRIKYVRSNTLGNVLDEVMKIAIKDGQLK